MARFLYDKRFLFNMISETTIRNSKSSPKSKTKFPDKEKRSVKYEFIFVMIKLQATAPKINKNAKYFMKSFRFIKKITASNAA